MQYSYPRIILILFCMILMMPSTNLALASDFDLTITAQYRQSVEVTLDLPSATEISTLDPAIASDRVSLTPIQNLFLNLTDIDPVTNEIVPELATTWTVSEDGLIWTFTLRDDVNWMQYDPATGQATTIRPVVADDFVYAIKRTCDSRLGGYYGAVLARVLAGCDVINQTPDEEVTDELIFGDTIQIFAPDALTVELHLLEPAAYFLSMTTMSMTAAVPKEAIAEFGDDWTAPGNIITNGPYILEENVRGVRRSFIKNTAFPSNLAGISTIERITYTVIEYIGTEFMLYQDNWLDTSGIPNAELQAVLDTEGYANQLFQMTDDMVFFFGFTHDTIPFDNVHVRRAFSAIINRSAFIEQIQQARGVPMIHFIPPGMINSPHIDEIGVGFNPDYAREQLALAGYPNCDGFPKIDIVTYPVAGAGTWAEFWAASIEEHLGCSPSLFNINDQPPFDNWLPLPDYDAPIQDPPNVWIQGWTVDYPDADAWVRGRLHCNADFPDEANLFRECSEIDDLIDEAATELDPDRRGELYYQIEEGFFGEDGEFPIAPIFMRANYILVKEWYTGPFETDGLFTGDHWNAYSIDMGAKLGARGE